MMENPKTIKEAIETYGLKAIENIVFKFGFSTCNNCNNVFVKISEHQLACSRSCMWNRRREEGKGIAKICAVCEKEFFAAGPKTVYCSPLCREKANLERLTTRLRNKTNID